jgi:hypothetical protein
VIAAWKRAPKGPYMPSAISSRSEIVPPCAAARSACPAPAEAAR